MADDLELAMRSIDGEGPSPHFVATLRERVLAEAADPTRQTDDQIVDIDTPRGEPAERPMTSTRWALAGSVAAALIALIVGLVVVSDNGTAPSDAPATAETRAPATSTAPTTASTTTTPPTTVPASAGTPGADADAGCGLSDVASVSATVDESGESVTIDVASDPSCAGVEVEVVAIPWTQGFPIEKIATLDDAGAASVTDHLLSTRNANQDWTVELLVRDTNGVAATAGFVVSGVCDLEQAELRAEHLAETNEVGIVLTLDPACAGETFTFDRDGIFASSPQGGWEVYTVGDDGRIEVTEHIVVPGPFIDVFAIPVAEERGVLAGHVARVTLDIGD